MDNFANFVHKEHHTLLEHFSGIGKAPNITEAKYANDFLTREHRIYSMSSLNILGNNRASGLTKTKGE